MGEGVMDATGVTRRRAFRSIVGLAAAGVSLAACNLGAPAATYPLTLPGSFVTDLVVGDVDDDGHLDIVGPVHGGYSVALGDGAGGFTVTQVQTFPAPGWLAELGDADGDDHLDLVYVAGSPSGDPPQLEVRRGDGTGRFSTTPRVLPAGAQPRDLGLGDLDGDDDLDVVAATGGGASVWLNRGSGVFARPTPVDTGTNASDIVVEDMNGDGAVDLVTGGFSPTEAVSVNLGDGDGGFSAPMTHGLGPVSGFLGVTTVGVADVNGDRSPDVYGGNGTFDQVFVLLGDGLGGLGAPIVSPANTATVPDLVAADLDVDGHLDLATGGSTVLFGDGAGHFPEEHPVLGGSKVVTADFDGNAQPDLAYAEGENMKVLLNHLDCRRDHE
jgi:trimeric autotransporter adhesin